MIGGNTKHANGSKGKPRNEAFLFVGLVVQRRAAGEEPLRIQSQQLAGTFATCQQ